jgi:xanthine dehydrogenase molybdopterin-binding subunit B
MPGVVAFLSAKDIPGKNSFTPVGLIMLTEDEEVCKICKNSI